MELNLLERTFEYGGPQGGQSLRGLGQWREHRQGRVGGVILEGDRGKPGYVRERWGGGGFQKRKIRGGPRGSFG
eukprot:766577-Hanusia_phi.AAC.9